MKNKQLFFIFFVSYSSLAYANPNAFSLGFTLDYSGDLQGNGDFSCSGKISHTSKIMDKMPLQTSLVWENGYFKPEMQALKTSRSNEMAADTANLVVFSQINTILDRNPALLAQLKKQCDARKKEKRELKKDTLSKRKAMHRTLQEFENQFKSLDMEYEE